jgi:hypothetical protein
MFREILLGAVLLCGSAGAKLATEPGEGTRINANMLPGLSD